MLYGNHRTKGNNTQAVDANRAVERVSLEFLACVYGTLSSEGHTDFLKPSPVYGQLPAH